MRWKVFKTKHDVVKVAYLDEDTTVYKNCFLAEDLDEETDPEQIKDRTVYRAGNYLIRTNNADFNVLSPEEFEEKYESIITNDPSRTATVTAALEGSIELNKTLIELYIGLKRKKDRKNALSFHKEMVKRFEAILKEDY